MIILRKLESNIGSVSGSIASNTGSTKRVDLNT